MQAIFPRIRMIGDKVTNQKHLIGQDKTYVWASPKLLKNHLRSLNFRPVLGAARSVDGYQKAFKELADHTYQVIQFKVGLSDRWISYPMSSELNELDLFPSMLEDAIHECGGRTDYPDC